MEEIVMKRYIIALVIPALFIGCGLPKSLRTPEKTDSSILGVSIKTITLKVFKNRQDTVYFVKLGDTDTGLMGAKIIPSNYSRGDYAYLVNAEPGKYAAVASFFQQSDNTYNSFFDLNSIQSTVTVVGTGQITYMGDITVDNHLKNIYNNIEQNGDKAQLHYYSLLKSFIYGTYYCGSLNKAERSKQLEKQYLIKSKDYFKDSDWLKIINSGIELLEKTPE
jgi:hypothetical protein